MHHKSWQKVLDFRGFSVANPQFLALSPHPLGGALLNEGKGRPTFWSAAGEILWISDDADYWAVFLFDANIVNGSWSESSKQREEGARASFYSRASHGWIIIGFSYKCTKRNWLQKVGEYAVDHFKTYSIFFLKYTTSVLEKNSSYEWPHSGRPQLTIPRGGE